MKYLEIVPNKHILFKITPHRSVLNSTTRRLLATLHDVMSMYDSPLARLTFDRPGRKIYYRIKDDLWWIVTINAWGQTNEQGDEETTRQVEFYVCVTEQFADVFLTKFKNHDQWAASTVEQVPLETIQIADADLYKLKYQRHDMFSLSYDYTWQTCPVREIISVSQEMAPGDFTGLFVRAETVGRLKWRGLADYAWDVWDRGQVPQRNNLDYGRLLQQAWSIFSFLTTQVKDILDDIMEGVEKAFLSGKDRTRAEKEKQLNPERQAILVNGDLSSLTKRKRNLPAFRTDIFLAVGSDTTEKRGMLCRSLAGAFNELKGDNSLIPVKFTYGQTFQKKSWLDMGQANDIDRNVLSTEELGKFWHLPTKDIQAEFADVLSVNKRVEIDVPKVFLNPDGIYMGSTTNRGETLDIHLPAKDMDMLMTTRAFIGSPRMGKDQAAINMVVESKLKHGIGAIIPDVIDERNGHRGMADAIRDHLPAEDIIDLNLADFDWPVYIGLDSVTKGMGNERMAANRVSQELTSFLMGDEVDENHQTREYLREAAKATGGDLVDLKMMLMSGVGEFRSRRIAELKAQGRDMSLWEDYESMSDGKRGQLYGPIITRLNEFMGDDFLKPIFCQRPNPAVDIESWMREGKVVIFRVPARDLSEMAVRTVMHWIIMTVFLTKLSMGGQGAPTWLILNEPHQYLSPGLVHFCKRLLVEGPKYHIAPVFIFHHFKLLPSDFVDILLSASLSWHIFKNTNDNVYKRLASYLEPTFTPELAISATKKYQYIASWLAPSGEYQDPFLMDTPALVSERYPTQDNSFLTKRHSRIYGRPIDDIEKEIQERMRGMFKAG